MDTQTFVDIYRTMIKSRIIDEFEDKVIRSGQAAFALPCAGHETAAVLATQLTEDDWLHCHYRDRALALARGEDLAAVLSAIHGKAISNSGGMRMPGFTSSPKHKLLSVPTAVGNNSLQAVGVAQSIKDQPSRPIVYCGIGDGSTQQGEFFEAIGEAVRSQLPLLFMVQDNSYALSTPTKGRTFYSTPYGELNEFMGCPITRVDGSDPVAAHNELARLVATIRETRKPQIVILKLARLTSHTSSDDETVYRKQAEIDEGRKTKDPILNLRKALIKNGVGKSELDKIDADLREELTQLLAEVRSLPNVDPEQVHKRAKPLPDFGDEYTGSGKRELSMLEAMREVMKNALGEGELDSVFGEDIADPKGDVFGLTRGLSTAFPGKVTNSALAEATIVGSGIGRALAGETPIACLQFADFMPLAFNQIFCELGSIYWRSKGEWNAPLTILAPCGAYCKGLGPFHAQTPTTHIASIPGIDVFVPSNAGDAAGLLNAALKSGRPSVLFYPKSLINDRTRGTSNDVAKQIVPIGKARIAQEGKDLTLVSWGSPMPICERVTEFLKEQGVSVELIDLRSVAPIDHETILASVKKTGKLIVAHEENKTCGIGGEILATVAEELGSSVSVARLACTDTWIPYDLNTQLSILPSFKSILSKAADLLGADLSWEQAATAEGGIIVVNAVGASPSDQNVKVAEILVKVGDSVEEGTALASVEADKAEMELCAPCPGTVTEILLEEGVEVDTGTPFVKLEPAEGASIDSGVADEKPHWTSGGTVNVGSGAGSKNIRITSISSVLGSRVMPNEKLLELCPGWTSDDVYKRTGIRSRYWINDKEDVLSLAVSAAEDLLKRENLEISDIDAIVCSTGTPHCVTPSLACRILYKLSEGEKLLIQAHDINAACSGYLYGIQQCYDILYSGTASKVLLITAETLSPLLNSDDPETYFLFGDAATASLVTTDPDRSGNVDLTICRPVLSSVGTDEKILYVPSTQGNEFLRMDGRPVFRLAVQQMINMLKQAAAVEDLPVEDLNVIVPHQANARIIESIRKTIKLDREKVFNMMEDHGNTSSNTIPLALERLMSERPGVKRIGLTAFGGGFTFGAAILNPQ